MRPLKPTMVKEILIAHYCGNEPVTMPLAPFVSVCFSTSEIVHFDCFRGLPVRLVALCAERNREAETGRRGPMVKALAPVAECRTAWSIASDFENCRDYGRGFDWARTALPTVAKSIAAFVIAASRTAVQIAQYPVGKFLIGENDGHGR
jgi:hypothetical protein